MDEQSDLQLTSGGLKKLGNLVNLKDSILADAIKERGGGREHPVLAETLKHKAPRDNHFNSKYD